MSYKVISFGTGYF